MTSHARHGRSPGPGPPQVPSEGSRYVNDLDVDRRRRVVFLGNKLKQDLFGAGEALGQTVKGLAPSRALLVIDQVGLSEGDYIDIGVPLMDGRVVPLVVKTLIFYH